MLLLILNLQFICIFMLQTKAHTKKYYVYPNIKHEGKRKDTNTYNSICEEGIVEKKRTRLRGFSHYVEGENKLKTWKLFYAVDLNVFVDLS